MEIPPTRPNGALDMRRSEVLAVLSLMVVAEAFFIARFLLFALADAAVC